MGIPALISHLCMILEDSDVITFMMLIPLSMMMIPYLTIPEKHSISS